MFVDVKGILVGGNTHSPREAEEREDTRNEGADVIYSSFLSAQFPRRCTHHAADGRPGKVETQHACAGIQARLEDAVEEPFGKRRRGGVCECGP